MLCASCRTTFEVETDAGRCPSCDAEPWLAGRYRLIRVTRASMQHTEFLATPKDAPSPRRHIKALHLASMRELRDLDRFDREAGLLRELEHGRLPAYVEHFQTGEGDHALACLVTEWISEAEPLEAWAGRHRFDPMEVLKLAQDILPALVYLHTRSPPVLHRDLQPQNVLRRKDGTLVLVNFGFARSDSTQSTLTSSFSLGYAAPEQLEGRATPRSDLYGLGALLVHLLTRRTPSVGILDSPDWDKLQSNLHPAAARWIRTLLAADPEGRPPSARTALADLRRIIELIEHAERAPPLRLDPPSPPPQRRWMLAALTVALALVAGWALSDRLPSSNDFTSEAFVVQTRHGPVSGFLSPPTVQVSLPTRRHEPIGERSWGTFSRAQALDGIGRPFFVEGSTEHPHLHFLIPRLVIRTPKGDLDLDFADVQRIERLDPSR